MSGAGYQFPKHIQDEVDVVTYVLCWVCGTANASIGMRADRSETQRQGGT